MTGGSDPSYAKVESWNGSAWTELANTAEGRGHAAGFGTTMGAAVTAGQSPAPPTATEEFTVPDATKTFTAS